MASQWLSLEKRHAREENPGTKSVSEPKRVNSVLVVKIGNTSQSLRGCVSGVLMNLPRCCGASWVQHSQASLELLPHRVPADRRCPAVPAAVWEQGPWQKQKKQEKKMHKPSRAEQTGFTELLSSQAPIPRTALVAHSLSRGLWAVKYGFMCAHITFGSRETFKSNYDDFCQRSLFRTKCTSRVPFLNQCLLHSHLSNWNRIFYSQE